MKVEFIRPEGIVDPLPYYKDLLTNMHKKIGAESLCSRLEIISTEWAIKSGYFFEIKHDETFVFTHVSLK